MIVSGSCISSIGSELLRKRVVNVDAGARNETLMEALGGGSC